MGEPLPENGLPAHNDDRQVDVGSASYTQERCKETVDRAKVLLEAIAELPARASPHLPAVQMAALLLRLCGCGKVTHLLRCAPPAVTQQAARSYDSALLDSYADLAELDPLTTAQALQCQLPLRLGGRGLRSQEQLAPAARVASWAQSVAAVLDRTGLDCLEDLETCALPLADACRQARASLPDAPANANDSRAEPPLGTWRELALEPRKKVQRMFSR